MGPLTASNQLSSSGCEGTAPLPPGDTVVPWVAPRFQRDREEGGPQLRQPRLKPLPVLSGCPAPPRPAKSRASKSTSLLLLLETHYVPKPGQLLKTQPRPSPRGGSVGRTCTQPLRPKSCPTLCRTGRRALPFHQVGQVGDVHVSGWHFGEARWDDGEANGLQVWLVADAVSVEAVCQQTQQVNLRRGKWEA